MTPSDFFKRQIWSEELSQFTTALDRLLRRPDQITELIEGKRPRFLIENEFIGVRPLTINKAVKYLALRHMNGRFETFILDPRTNIATIAPSEAIQLGRDVQLPLDASRRIRMRSETFLKKNFSLPETGQAFHTRFREQALLIVEPSNEGLLVRSLRFINDKDAPPGPVVALKTGPGRMPAGTETLPPSSPTQNQPAAPLTPGQQSPKREGG